MLNSLINFYCLILDSILNISPLSLVRCAPQNILLNMHFNDAPYPWQIAFQDPASPGFIGISDLHDNIIYYLVLILLGVMWVLSMVFFVFKSTSNSLVYKYLSHGTLMCLHTNPKNFTCCALLYPYSPKV